MSTKFITFFNGKGGVGKTALTLMAASYLKYHCGAKVAVIDLEYGNYPVQRAREGDLALLKDPNSTLSTYMSGNGCPVKEDAFYPIFLMGVEGNVYMKEDLVRSYNQMVKLKEKGLFDYVLVDFPAGYFDKGLPSLLLGQGVIDLCLIPTDVSTGSLVWARDILRVLQKNGTPSVVVWNRISWYDRTGGLVDKLSEQFFRSSGFEVCPVVLKQFAKASRDSGVKNFVMSTVCWPDANFRLAKTEDLPEFFEWVRKKVEAVE